MQLAPYIEALESDLATIASMGDEQVAAAAERLAQALRASLGLRLLDLLGEAALEVSAQIPSGHVEVRLAGQEPSLVFVAAEAEEAPSAGEEGPAARITLRLPDSLKVSIEAAATREGLSVNTWLVRALGRSVTGGLGGTSRGPGSRLSGWAQS